MTIENAPPSVDPAVYDSLPGMMEFIFKKLLQKIDGVLPARVLAFRRGPPAVVQVQPVIEKAITNGQTEPRAPIGVVPVYQIGGGGMMLAFNLKPGDLGLLVAMDADTSLFLQSGKDAVPNTYRNRNFSSSFFLPMMMNNYTIDGDDAENAVLQTIDGTVGLSISPTGVKIKGQVEILNDLKVNGNIYGGANITAAGSITPDTPPP